MNIITLNKKKYVVIPEGNYDKLVTQATLKTNTARKYSLEKGKKIAHSLIDKWHRER